MFIAESKELLDALKRVLPATEGSSQINDIFACVLIECLDKEVRLTGSDGQVQLSTICGRHQAKTSEKKFDAFAISSRKLNDILSNANDTSVEFHKVDKKNVEIIAGTSKYKLMLRDGADFPLINNKGKADLQVKLPLGKLKEIIERTNSAISNNNHRIYLAGAYFDFLEDALHIVATDGHRLATGVIAECKTKSDEGINFILPRKAVSVLRGILDSDAEKEIEVQANKENDVYRNACFMGSKTVLNCSLIQGQYPNYKRVIPDEKDNHIHCQFNRDALLHGVRQACAVHDRKGNGIKLNFSGEKGVMHLNSQGNVNPDEAAVEVNVQLESDENFVCQINSEFLINMLDSFNGINEMKLAFKEPTNSVLCLPVEESKIDFRYVVMPMR